MFRSLHPQSRLERDNPFMQYRLSTIFLVFFFAAATLAPFGAWGIWIGIVLGAAALAFNRSKTTMDGMIRVFYIVLIGIVCPGLLQVPSSRSMETARRSKCMYNMKLLCLALHNYHDKHKRFPAVITCDKDGKPLYSWLVEILPELDRRDIYDRLNKDEPWDSSHNAKILNLQKMDEFICPSANHEKDQFASNYIAIIGPGTIWRNEGPVSIKDLPKDLSNIVVAVECAESDKHWAEPYTITVEEVLERMKTGKGMRISTAHRSVVEVLFADGHVQSLRTDLSISQWQRVLMGETTSNADRDIGSEDPNDPPAVNISTYIDTSPPEPGEWTFKLCILVWVISVGLLFYRAWSSRKTDIRHAPIAG
jgi:prepilin-type processing-associated H-X9-DG protein